MSYYRRGYSPRVERKRFSGPEIEASLKRLSGLEGLTPWESNFISSIQEGYKKYNSLTEGQFNTFQKIDARYNPENIKKREDWNNSFTSEMREKLEIMARYYKANPPYYSDLAERILSDPNYIPTEKAYRSMCENKYAQRVINTSQTEPEYSAGSMAVVRDSRNIGGTIARYRGKMVVVLDHPETVTNAARGARPVRVLPVGAVDSIVTEERWLKKVPKKLR
jgi:hypothetical protein